MSIRNTLACKGVACALIGDVVEIVELLCLAILSTPGEGEKWRENPGFKRRTASPFQSVRNGELRQLFQ